MADKKQVMFDIERCICHVPDACRDCSKYKGVDGLRCMEELMADAYALLKEQDGCENCAIAIEDRQPVVYCKDCKYWLPMNRFDPDYHPGRGQCELNCWIRDSDWFCADGERR